jgi:hypothetical protein
MAEIFFDTIEQLPEELQSEAKKNADGKIVINLVPKARVDEFREKNIALSKDNETFTARIAKFSKFVGEDEDKFIDELSDLRKTKQLVEDGKLSESGKIEEILAERTKKMRENHEEELRRLATDASEWKKNFGDVTEQLKGVQVDNYIRSAIHDPKSGARPEAESHILLEAKKVFKIDGDKIIPKNGDSTIYGADGASPMSPIEWMKQLQKQMPYLFRESNGGGANGGQLTGYGNMTKDDLMKLSPQQRLELANKAAFKK